MVLNVRLLPTFLNTLARAQGMPSEGEPNVMKRAAFR